MSIEVNVSVDWLKQVHRDLDACQKVIWLAGCRPQVPNGFDPSYVTDAQARLKEIEARIATATVPGQPAAHKPQTCNGKRCGWCKEGAEPCHYAAPVQQVSVPDGYAIVPIAPTPEMIKAALDKPCFDPLGDLLPWSHITRTSYAAMLAAAPAAPAADAGLVEALRKIMEAHRFNSAGMSVTEVHAICFDALATHRAKGVV